MRVLDERGETVHRAAVVPFPAEDDLFVCAEVAQREHPEAECLPLFLAGIGAEDRA